MNNHNLSIPIVWIVTIIFVILKMTGTITWGWIYVFSPIWFPIVIVLGVLVIYLTFLFILSVFNSFRG